VPAHCSILLLLLLLQGWLMRQLLLRSTTALLLCQSTHIAQLLLLLLLLYTTAVLRGCCCDRLAAGHPGHITPAPAPNIKRTQHSTLATLLLLLLVQWGQQRCLYLVDARGKQTRRGKQAAPRKLLGVCRGAFLQH
jgi:hypothetical protein